MNGKRACEEIIGKQINKILLLSPVGFSLGKILVAVKSCLADVKTLSFHFESVSYC